MKRKILHVLGTAREENASIARIVTILADGIDRDKYSFHACFLGGEGPLADELERHGVSVFFASWSRGVLDPLGAGRFWRAICGREFAIAHIHFGGGAVRWLARSTGASVIVHAHDLGPESDLDKPGSITVEGAHAVIACSRAVAERIVGARTRVVYTGIPVPAIATSRSVTGAGGNSRVIGAAGRLVPIKGFQHLIRAFALIWREFPECVLEIAGAGPEHARLTDEIRKLGLEDVTVLRGWQNRLTPLFHDWHLYVQPSLREGLPMAVLEAMASGLPVLASNVGGLPELIEDGITGWLVEPANPEALAERIRWMLLNDEACIAMGCAAKARVYERFSEQRMVSEISAIYDALTGSGRGSAHRDQRFDHV